MDKYKRLLIYPVMIAMLTAVWWNSQGVLGSPVRSKTKTPKPQRIISCSLATDELLLALIPPEERSRIIALSALAADQTYSNIPTLPDQPLKTHPKMIERPCHGENLEPLLYGRPDLVLLAAYSSPLLKSKLEQNHIKFFQSPSPQSLDDIAQTILSLAKALGEDAKGQELFQWFRTEREALRSLRLPQTLAQRRVIHLFSDGTISGQNTIFDSLAQEIPITNQASAMGLKGYSKYSIETLLALNPDRIILGGDPMEGRDLALKKIRNIPGIPLLKNLSKDQLIILPERELGSVSHHLIFGLRRLKEELIRGESP